MGNTGRQDDRSTLVHWWAARSRVERRALLVAFAISLTAHLVLLGTARDRREGDARTPVFRVTLTGTFSAPAHAELPELPAAPAKAQPMPLPEVKTPRPEPPAPSLRESAPAAALAVARPVPVAAPRAPAPAQPATPSPAGADSERRVLVAPAQPEQPASPLSSPVLGDVSPSLRQTRLGTRLFIDENGKVLQASVRRYEISEEVGKRLEQALAATRFAPARTAGRPVPSILDTKLCFDRDGVVDTNSPECLRPAPPAEAQAAEDTAPTRPREEVATPP